MPKKAREKPEEAGEKIMKSQKKEVMFKWIIIISSLVVCFLLPGYGEAKMVATSHQEDQEKVMKTLSAFLPLEIEGWKTAGADELYTPETIFNYIDGSGEVYRSYGFRWLLVRRYQKKGSPEIIVDFFSMGRSEDAFGVFTHNLEGEKVNIGQDGIYQGGWLAFWKDKFYVSVYAEAETPESKKAILTAGRLISQAIPGEGERPAILNLLPEEVDKTRVHYFHTLPILNYHFFVTSENWLDLDETTEAVLGRLRNREKEKTSILIIRYPDEARARKAVQQFLKGYLPEADESGAATVEDGFWTGARASGKIGIIVFSSVSFAEIDNLINQVINKAREINLQ